MIDLNNNTLADIPKSVRCFNYDRSEVSPGIIHLSVGNFHRAHQAWYIDRLLEQPGNEQWALCGVGLIDDRTERLKTVTFPQQDDLYTLTLCPPEGPAQHQVIGSIVEYVFAPTAPSVVVERMSDPAIKIVSLTITEGGYNQDKRTGEYLVDAPQTARELAKPTHPRTAFGFIVAALRRRRSRGVPPFTVLSCDNLRNNGEIAKAAVIAHARALDTELADWIEANVAFPSSMVDRITPATLKEDAERINGETGVLDLLPIFAEDFGQWVIEDKFCDGRPPLETVGVQFVDDVHPYELTKVRMLNGSHVMLAYPARLAGYLRVDEAMADPLLRRLLERFMTDDVMPLLHPAPGMELAPYRDKLIERFANPSVGDQVMRIAGDGVAKLPVYLLPTLEEQIERGADHRLIAFNIACFLAYLAGHDDNGALFKPFEPNLEPADLALALDTDPHAAFRISFLEAYAGNEKFVAEVVGFRRAIAERGTLKVLEELLG